MKKAFYFLTILFKGIFILAFTALLWQYFFNVKYKFDDPRPFHGNYFYNPYADIDSSKWEKANFHVHTHTWLGICNGSQNRCWKVDSLYRYLGYNIVNISDYERINHYERNNKWYIPEYEHGYLFPKNHQLVLNACKTTWFDYFFPETKDNEQEIINDLKKDTSCLVAIAHPSFRGAYSQDELKYLNGYDFIEAYNNICFSGQHFDSALSSGHLIYLLADDDSHDISDIYSVGRCCTIINTALDKDSIMKSLKEGKAFGADIYMHDNESYRTKKEIISRLPVLTSVQIINDTLTVQLNAEVKSFSFIGQGGTLRKRISGGKSAHYVIQKSDTYIRTEIVCADGTVYYLNPVFRYDGIHLPSSSSKTDISKTILYSATGSLALLMVSMIFFRPISQLHRIKRILKAGNA